MAFAESVKASVRRRAHFTCCLCKTLGVEIHHIEPQEEGGSDSEDNAAPLCPSCHETYGANRLKRKFIREARDFWYEICEARYGSDAARLDEIERLLKNIESHVKTSTSPLLPFSLFYTLRHTTTEDAISLAFRHVKGYRSLKNDLLQLKGTVRLGGSGVYNSIEFSPKHSHCTLDENQLESLVEGNSGFESVIKNPTKTTIEFCFPGDSDAPSLSLEKAFGDGKPREVKNLELFDDTIFQDAVVTRWEVTNPSRRAWGVADLEGALIRFRIKFMSFDDVNINRPPLLHNLHLYFGRDTPQILFFKSEQLLNPAVFEDPKPLAKWDFSGIGMTVRQMIMQYEFSLDETTITNQLKQVI